jgi:hypothetical protein
MSDSSIQKVKLVGEEMTISSEVTPIISVPKRRLTVANTVGFFPYRSNSLSARNSSTMSKTLNTRVARIPPPENISM